MCKRASPLCEAIKSYRFIQSSRSIDYAPLHSTRYLQYWSASLSIFPSDWMTVYLHRFKAR